MTIYHIAKGTPIKRFNHKTIEWEYFVTQKDVFYNKEDVALCCGNLQFCGVVDKDYTISPIGFSIYNLPDAGPYSMISVHPHYVRIIEQ